MFEDTTLNVHAFRYEMGYVSTAALAEFESSE